MYSKEKQIGKRFIPKMGDRTKISQKVRERVAEVHGDRCRSCWVIADALHHVKFASQGGKGTLRNLIPLCRKHHARIHDDRSLAEMSRNLQIAYYGEYYWCDKYDLYRMGLIDNPNEAEFEAFMKKQEYVEPEPDPSRFDYSEFPF